MTRVGAAAVLLFTLGGAIGCGSGSAGSSSTATSGRAGSTTTVASSSGTPTAASSTGGSTTSSSAAAATSSGGATQATTAGSTASSSSGTTAASGSTTSGSSGTGTRTIDALSSPNGTQVTTGFSTKPGTCNELAFDTSSCTAARTALGLSGNWLSFSCNVVEGLADASQSPVTSIGSATYVTLATSDLPDYDSNYWQTSGMYSFTAYGVTVTGDFDALYQAFSTYFPDPNTILQKSFTLYVPLAPAASTSESEPMAGMFGGIEGMALDGVVIFDSAAGMTDNIFAESGSFDHCGGHPDNSSTYHYHAEPYSLSYDDDHLIGVMRDGFFIYGRQDADGSTPGTLAAQLDGGAGSGNLLYVYGGHTGAAPSADDTNAFHYHLTEWKGCYDETTPGGMMGPPTKSADDGESYDPTGAFNTPAATTCGGQWVDAWFLTGHGNGGTFATEPSGLSGQAPAQTETAVRYFYGMPGPCTGCMGG